MNENWTEKCYNCEFYLIGFYCKFHKKKIAHEYICDDWALKPCYDHGGIKRSILKRLKSIEESLNQQQPPEGYISCEACGRLVHYGACFGRVCPECEADHLTGRNGAHKGICGDDIYL